MAALALPHVQRRTPIAVAAYAPILHVFEPIAETPFADAFRDPVYRVVVFDEFVAHGGHADKP